MCFSILWKARNIELFVLKLFQSKSPFVMENVALRRELFRKILSKRKQHQIDALFPESKSLAKQG